MDIDAIRADFAILDDWEDRYRYVIELGRTLAPLAESDRNEATKVRGCVSQVWLASRWTPSDHGPPRLSLTGDSDALIVRGLVAILLAMYDGRTAAEVHAIDAHAILRELGLSDHLTPQRSNGLKSMVERIRADAARQLALEGS